MKENFFTVSKRLIFLMIGMGALNAYAGQSTILSKTETIEIKNPTQAFKCHLGDGGYVPTTISLNAWSIPGEFGNNFKDAPGISAQFFRQYSGEAFPCDEAMKTIDEEIKRQGGQLKAVAKRNLARWAIYDNGCQLLLAENIEITVGTVGLFGVNTHFVTELPISSPFKCHDLIPDKI